MRITSHPLRGPAATAAVRKSPALDRSAPVHLRLLGIGDAAFLDGFRIAALSRPDLIPRYKVREAEGVEFCFVIVAHGRDLGLVRMHDFAEIAGEPSFTWGNWATLRPDGTDLFGATARLIYAVGFGTLGFARAHLSVPKANPGLAAFHLETGAELEHDDGEHLYLRVAPGAGDRLSKPSPARLSRPFLVSG